MKKEFDPQKKLYTLSILVDDVPGVLSQVARLFSRKGYNIESIVSGATDRPGITRISIEIIADELMLEQIAAQCRKLLPVQAVKILDEETSIRQENAFVKVRAANRTERDEILQLANIFHAKGGGRGQGSTDHLCFRQSRQAAGFDPAAGRFRHHGDRQNRYHRH